MPLLYRLVQHPRGLTLGDGFRRSKGMVEMVLQSYGPIDRAGACAAQIKSGSPVTRTLSWAWIPPDLRLWLAAA
jgi:hypothetical protein